jgi:hypothetical protein
MVKQVAGTHYKSSFQHWDFVEMFEIGYLEANATKYVLRWKKKNGVEDLKKAKSYVEKLILEMHFNDRRSKSTIGDDFFINEFCISNKLGEKERNICHVLLAQWEVVEELEAVIGWIDQLIEEASQPRIDSTGQDSPFGYDGEEG